MNKAIHLPSILLLFIVSIYSIDSHSQRWRIFSKSSFYWGEYSDIIMDRNGSIYHFCQTSNNTSGSSIWEFKTTGAVNIAQTNCNPEYAQYPINTDTSGRLIIGTHCHDTLPYTPTLWRYDAGTLNPIAFFPPSSNYTVFYDFKYDPLTNDIIAVVSSLGVPRYLKAYRFSNGQWSLIGNVGTGGNLVHVRMDSKGTPYILYTDTIGNLKVQQYKNSIWNDISLNLQTPGSSIKYDLCFDSLDKPYLAIHHWDSTMVFQYLNGTWTNMNLPQRFNVKTTAAELVYQKGSLYLYNGKQVLKYDANWIAYTDTFEFPYTDGGVLNTFFLDSNGVPYVGASWIDSSTLNQTRPAIYVYDTLHTSVLNNTDIHIEPIIYPNPTKEVLYISFPKEDEREIQLMDLSGRMQHQSKQMSDKVSIDVSNRTSGIYLLKILNSEGMLTKKVLIE